MCVRLSVKLYKDCLKSTLNFCGITPSKRDQGKAGPPSTSNFECQICHPMCRSRIGLLAHNQSHLWWYPSRRRLSPWCLSDTA